MKKLTIFLFAAALVLTSCDNTTDPGGTAVQDLAGDWWVTYENAIEEYDVLFGTGTTMPSPDTLERWSWEDIYGAGHSRLLTYNTAANLSTEMFVSGAAKFWNTAAKGYTGIVPVNYTNLQFGSTDTIQNEAYNIPIIVTGGKVLKGAATTPSGMPADSVVFYLYVPDDKYGFTYFKVTGFRRTGFPEDDF